ncbi:hypothetical protein BH23GEM2_BH23GEM2_23020 [soil metagenome]
MTRFSRLYLQTFILPAMVHAVSSACASQAVPGNAAEGRLPKFEIFILQPGYRGPFVAIYADTNGITPAWRGDTGIYHVPATGVVRIAHAEPPRSTKVAHVFSDAPDKWIGNYRTCADMRVYVPDGDPRVCWLDFWAGGTGVADHVVALITDWGSIPEAFHRTTVVYDSVLHGGTGKVIRKWEEPPDLNRRTPAPRVQ